MSGLVLPKPCRPARRVPVIAFNGHGRPHPLLQRRGGDRHPQPGAGQRRFVVVVDDEHHRAGPRQARRAGVPGHREGMGDQRRVQPARHRRPDISSQIIRRTYRCPAGTDVEFYIIIGGGHAWPGSKFSQEISSITGYTTFQINTPLT